MNNLHFDDVRQARRGPGRWKLQKLMRSIDNFREHPTQIVSLAHGMEMTPDNFRAHVVEKEHFRENARARKTYAHAVRLLRDKVTSSVGKKTTDYLRGKGSTNPQSTKFGR